MTISEKTSGQRHAIDLVAQARRGLFGGCVFTDGRWWYFRDNNYHGSSEELDSYSQAGARHVKQPGWQVVGGGPYQQQGSNKRERSCVG